MISKRFIKAMGMLMDEQGVELVEGFNLVLLKQIKTPFPIREISLLFKEATDLKKRHFASSMNMQIKVMANKPFPDSQLITLLRTKYSKEKSKILLYQEIINLIFDIYGESEELTAEKFLSNEQRIYEQFGPAHFYWGLRLFPIHDSKIEHRLLEFEEQLSTITDAAKETAATNLAESKDESKEAKENSLITKERNLRVKAELEIESLKKEIRSLEKSQERIKETNELISSEKLFLEKKLSEMDEATEAYRNQVINLEAEKENLNNQLNNLQKTLDEQTTKEQQTIQDYENKLRELNTGMKLLIQKYEEDIKKLKDETSSSNLSLNEAVKMLMDYLYQAIEINFAQLKTSLDRTDREQLRKKMNDHMQLMDSFELLLEELIKPLPQINPEKTVDETTQQTKELPKKDNPNNEIPHAQPGTFYRMDHGGYIKLENGAAFNIPESLVNSLQLEHEAEVECEPAHRADGSVNYIIRMLFQGDDTRAPITQYMGYIELGEHFKYYCVDISDPNNRYPLYEKDFEIQKPKDGDPCLFNVAHGGEHARLSKLYTSYSTDYYKKENMNDKPIKGNTGTVSREKHESPNAGRDPFLEGCKIVIIGGLKKWFDSVVEETGAEFYHENGESPSRIHPKLRRADALFYLLTANSHEATTSCIPIAKEQKIPHFKIEGSKSNLRKLLWDNRDMIRNKKTPGL
ncbi:hypothetical protein ACE41H_12245 [Paenibacillus enshidis]|uniref:DUF2325 domain-containing protein n=1 Tax=Paenibacillus enshidis TaxID=1458439 RepID=A0ABV5ATJ3_9BACL